MSDYSAELQVAIEAARSAAAAILSIYETAAVRTKADGSYVTDADLASDRVIRDCLSQAYPDDAILTEEIADDHSRFKANRCWIVDPIDGTAAFVERSGDFDVYIALVVDLRPVVAVTFQPTTGLLLTAMEDKGAWLSRPDQSTIPLRYTSPGDAIRLGTRKWLGAPGNLPWLDRVASQIDPKASALSAPVGLGVRSFIQPGTVVDAIVGYTVDGSPLDGWEWDIAAVDLIVREAGGSSTDITGSPLRFNQLNLRQQSLLLSTDPTSHDRILKAVESVGAG